MWLSSAASPSLANGPVVQLQQAGIYRLVCPNVTLAQVGCCCGKVESTLYGLVMSSSSLHAVAPKQAASQRDTLRLAIPSKGRMAEDTQQLLKVTTTFLTVTIPLDSCPTMCASLAGLPAVCVQAESPTIHSTNTSGRSCASVCSASASLCLVVPLTSCN